MLISFWLPERESQLSTAKSLRDMRKEEEEEEEESQSKQVTPPANILASRHSPQITVFAPDRSEDWSIQEEHWGRNAKVIASCTTDTFPARYREIQLQPVTSAFVCSENSVALFTNGKHWTQRQFRFYESFQRNQPLHLFLFYETSGHVCACWSLVQAVMFS